MKNKISILIPFLNEEDNIANLSNELNSFFSEQNEITFELIFIDDGSTDKSLEMLSDSTFVCPTKLIVLSKNFGSHAALRAGISQASGQLICFQYADLQDPLSLILDLKTEIEKGFSIVWGQRRKTQSGIFSSIYSKLMQQYVNPNYPTQGFDVVMFDEKVKEQLKINVEANSSIFLQILNLGFKQSFISYEKKKRQKGVSKWTLSKKIKLFIDSFIAFSYFPIRMVSLLGIILFLLGFLFAIYLIVRKIIWDDLDSGWPALISILSIGFGVTNISLGVIAEYLWRTLDASRKRPVYTIDKIIEKDGKNQ